MQSSKFLPKPTITGKPIEKNSREFEAKGKKGIEFTLILQKVYKDASGNKVEGESYFYKVVAYGDQAVKMVNKAIQEKLMMSVEGYPKLESWNDKETGQKKERSTWVADFITIWKYDQGQWHSVDANEETEDLPY